MDRRGGGRNWSPHDGLGLVTRLYLLPLRDQSAHYKPMVVVRSSCAAGSPRPAIARSIFFSTLPPTLDQIGSSCITSITGKAGMEDNAATFFLERKNSQSIIFP